MQQVLDGDLGAAQFDRQLHGDIEDEIDIVVRFRLRCLLGKVLEHGGAGRAGRIGGLVLQRFGFRLGLLGNGRAPIVFRALVVLVVRHVFLLLYRVGRQAASVYINCNAWQNRSERQ
ncbi:hypothetical protein D3C72_1743540 [compost metagenome]